MPFVIVDNDDLKIDTMIDVYAQDHDREEQAPHQRGNHCKGTMLDQGSPIVWGTKRLTRSVDRRGLEERIKVAFALDQKDILGLDLFEHEKPGGGLYSQRHK